MIDAAMYLQRIVHAQSPPNRTTLMVCHDYNYTLPSHLSATFPHLKRLSHNSRLQTTWTFSNISNFSESKGSNTAIALIYKSAPVISKPPTYYCHSANTYFNYINVCKGAVTLLRSQLQRCCKLWSFGDRM